MPHRHADPIVNFYLLALNSEAELAGGTGIFLYSRLNYLRALGQRIRLRVLPVAGARRGGRLNTLVALPAYILRHFRLLLGQPAGLYYLVYPKVPLVAFGVPTWLLPCAILGYLLFWLRKKLTGAAVVVEIEDLPVENGYLRASETVPDLDRCRWRRLTLPEKLYTLLEWVIFHSADHIIHPSPAFSGHVAAKFAIPAERMRLYRREIYMPSYTSEPRLGPLPDLRRVNVFYSGNLTLDFLVPNLRQVIEAIAGLPDACLYVCGSDGAWIEEWCHQRGQDNVHYLGLLSHADHDAAARQCQVGLMLYGHSYADFKCTAKYPAYVANGLAVLSTDLHYLSQVIAEDGAGKALPMNELVAELARWVAQPELIEPYRSRAQTLSREYLRGTYMAEWFEPLMASGR